MNSLKSRDEPNEIIQSRYNTKRNEENRHVQSIDSDQKIVRLHALPIGKMKGSRDSQQIYSGELKIGESAEVLEKRNVLVIKSS